MKKVSLIATSQSMIESLKSKAFSKNSGTTNYVEEEFIDLQSLSQPR